MKVKIFCFFVGILLIIAALRGGRSLYKENQRLTSNIETLSSDLLTYKVKDSLNAAGIDRLLYTKSELKKYNSELEKEVESLNIKLKRVETISRTATVSEYDIGTLVKDSVVYHFRDSTKMVYDTLHCINHTSEWIDLSGCYWDNDRSMLQNSAVLRVVTRDTLVQVVHRVPKRFLFFKYGCKGIRQEILSKNPHSRIVYSQYIEIE